MKAASEHLESFIHSDYAKRKKKKWEKETMERGNGKRRDMKAAYIL